MVRIRAMGESDLDFADSLRALAGWNQTRTDWKRLLSLAPNGCFLAEWDGRPTGVVTTTNYGALAWIGMLLVHPDLQRRGIGRALLEHAITYLQSEGVRCIKLDATPAGEPVYTRLGFKPEWKFSRWEGEAVPGSQEEEGSGPKELSEVATHDAALFGVSRLDLLQALARNGVIIRLRPPDENTWGFVREGARACYLGPATAANEAAGTKLISALLSTQKGRLFYWDIPEMNMPAVKCAERLGFRRQRQLTRMFLGTNFSPGMPEKVWAIAAPETG